MSFTSTQLQAEIDTDPKGLGYAALVTSGNDAGIAALLNSTTSGGTGTVFKSAVAASDVQTALDPTEFGTLSMTQLNQLSVIISGAVVNSGVASVRQIIVGIFAPAASFPNTRAALTALAQKVGSRAEVLFGAGTIITALDVAKALGRS